MPEPDAKQLVVDLLEKQCLATRADIIRHVAALSALFPNEMARTAFDVDLPIHTFERI